MSNVVATTIDDLYRKIAGIDNVKLCWAFANPRCADLKTSLPAELCAKIRMHLPPSSYLQLATHRDEGYAISDHLSMLVMNSSLVRVTQYSSGTKESYFFAATVDDERDFVLHSYESTKNFSEAFRSMVGYDTFTHEVNGMQVKVETRSVPHDDWRKIGCFEFRTPSSAIDLSYSRDRDLVVELSQIGGFSGGEISFFSDGRNRVSMYVSPHRGSHLHFQVERRGRDCAIVSKEKYPFYQLTHEATDIILELAGRLI